MISEPVLICLFRDSLRPSIRAQAKQEGRQKDTWDHVIKKAITAEAKNALNLPSRVRGMDTRCLQGHHSASKPTKHHTRDQGSLLFYSQKDKPCVFIVLSELRPWKDRAGTIRRVSTIEIAAIAAPTAPGLRAPPRPLGSAQPRPWLEMIMAATNQHVGVIGT